MQPEYWRKATRHLSKECPTMATLIARYKGESLRARPDGFYSLLRAVVGQQISVKAADSIWKRLEKAVKPLTPEKLLRVRDTTLRKVGLSQQKVAYAKNVAKFFAENHIDAAYWAARDDSQVIEELVSIKGIGTWTAEMFLIFHLTRPDIFPVKDLGVLKAVDLHYTGGKRLKPKEYIEFAKRWAPYRSVATWYLWRALDPVPVEY
jgi:DNA-3-methyladenine glycosylase II